MQSRHLDRYSYFKELANTSRDFYVDYLGKYIPIRPGMRVLEIGCGEGGNLLPFAEKGCEVIGIDQATSRIEQAKQFFSQLGYEGHFIHADFFQVDAQQMPKYDVVLIHDVIEHIAQDRKAEFMRHVKDFLSLEGIVFWGFPAWQMPFGGHQQICPNRLLSHLPFIHLLPMPIYKCMLRWGVEDSCVRELLDIKSCRVSIERFESLLDECGMQVLDRVYWFINPHYKQKFGLRPRRLVSWIASLKYIRNFFCTSCFYLTK